MKLVQVTHTCFVNLDKIITVSYCNNPFSGKGLKFLDLFTEDGKVSVLQEYHGTVLKELGIK